MEGKGGHACPSHRPQEVGKVIFPEVTCRWEHSKRQGVPGIKGLQQRDAQSWNLESVTGLGFRLLLFLPAVLWEERSRRRVGRVAKFFY